MFRLLRRMIDVMGAILIDDVVCFLLLLFLLVLAVLHVFLLIGVDSNVKR